MRIFLLKYIKKKERENEKRNSPNIIKTKSSNYLLLSKHGEES
jgi:hypothetical protein